VIYNFNKSIFPSKVLVYSHFNCNIAERFNIAVTTSPVQKFSEIVPFLTSFFYFTIFFLSGKYHSNHCQVQIRFLCPVRQVHFLCQVRQVRFLRQPFQVKVSPFLRVRPVQVSQFYQVRPVQASQVRQV